MHGGQWHPGRAENKNGLGIRQGHVLSADKGAALFHRRSSLASGRPACGEPRGPVAESRRVHHRDSALHVKDSWLGSHMTSHSKKRACQGWGGGDGEHTCSSAPAQHCIHARDIGSAPAEAHLPGGDGKHTRSSAPAQHCIHAREICSALHPRMRVGGMASTPAQVHPLSTVSGEWQAHPLKCTESAPALA